MENFTRQLLTEWRKLELPFAGETLIVAISGGADSVSLALALNDLKKRNKLNLRFVLAHFNHQLRDKESDADEIFVKNIAEKFGFELALGNGEIPKNENLEQSARKARYDFLYESAENLKAFAVLTAHTLNDQAETFLINLIRGSGLEGLGAIKIKRNLKKNSEILLIRPLLSWAKRIDTENFCRSNEIEFRYDSMNEDLAFQRVRIRKVLLPLLEDFNPKIIENLTQTAFLLQQDFDDLEIVRAGNRQLFESELNSEISLKILKKLTDSERNDLIRHWIKNNRGDLRRLDAKHFEAISRLIVSRKSGRKVELPNGENVLKTDGKLLFEKRKVEK
ncbi:MAG: tRNA lysidine(34) synthetase TilS [Pyrinomonadaceae bacterium]